MKQLNKEFNEYTKKDRFSTATFKYIESDVLPKDIPISTPINFVFVCDEVILTHDKNNMWGPVCGKIEQSETWEEALIRETSEEVGAVMSELYLCGYVLCENVGNINFPNMTILPVCYSYATSINYEWVRRETLNREMFSHTNTKKILKARNDNDHVLDMYLSVFERKNRGLSVNFRFVPGIILSGVPVTSAMVFCLDSEKKVCIVKDGDENFYSLPGGGKMLAETPEDCALRELNEEAQIIGKNIKVFGTILVSFYQQDKLISSMQQSRYLCEIKSIKDFVPFRDGFETDVRLFVGLDQLQNLVEQLKNDSGLEIIELLSKKL